MPLAPSVDLPELETLDVMTVTMVGLLAASVGYEAGSVLAGDSLALFWLFPAFMGTFVVALLAAQADD